MPEQAENVPPLSDALSEKEPDAPVQDTEKRFELLSSYFPEAVLSECGLDAQDMKIITVLIEHLIDGRGGMNTGEIMRGLKKGKIQALTEIQRLERLVKAGVLETDAEHEGSSFAMIGATFSLSNEFMVSVFEKDKKPTCPPEPYKDNMEYLADQFERVRLLQEIKGKQGRKIESKWKTAPASKGRCEKELTELENRIEKRLGMTNTAFPFEVFKKIHRLDQKEELVVLTLLRREFFHHRGYDADEMAVLISQTPFERVTNMRFFDEDAKLIRQKIITNKFSLAFDMPSLNLYLNRNVKRLLLGQKIQKIGKKLHDDLFEIVMPEVSIDHVILNPETLDEITLAMEMVRGKVAERLRAWGIQGVASTTRTNKRTQQPVTMLFHGHPGTGKTLTAHAVASKLKRPILTMDCSKIVDKYVGESEKNVAGIFDSYDEAAKRMRQRPVLLLNEADQFLHKRIEASRSTDHMYNQMQNIFLEKIEQFDGILIATTNLIESLDTAFSRRFHFKIEFRRPGPAERHRLWQIHMPQNAPLAEDINLERLADMYDLSGGQIAVVIRNAAAKAAMAGDEISEKDLVTACEHELEGSFDNANSQKIGFGR